MPHPVPDDERYAVVVCPHCRHAKGVDRRAKTTTCGRCDKRHGTAELRAFYVTGDPKELRVAVGVVETKVTGGETALIDVRTLAEEIERRHWPDRRRAAPPPGTDDEAIVQYAASAAAGIVSIAKKVRAIFEALDETRSDGWTQEEAEAAFEAARLPIERAEKEIRKALVQDEVYEPRPGRLRLL